MQFRNIQFENSSIKKISQYAQLYKNCFPHNNHINECYLEWLYKDNPVGHMMGVDAYVDGQLVGNASLIPGEFLYQGKPISCVFALNFGVLPQFQGRGITRTFVDLTCELLASSGYSLILGVSNAMATVVLKRQGFQCVTPLDAAIGFCSPYDSSDTIDPQGLQRIWRSQTLQWRINNPSNKVLLCKKGLQSFAAYTSSRKLGLVAYAELPAVEHFEVVKPSIVHAFAPKIFIGMSGARPLRNTYKNIPMKYRPSPLNFMVKDVRNDGIKINKEDLHINFLDLDIF